MNKKPIKYWMLVASKNHVLRGTKDGIAQACHGKAFPHALQYDALNLDAL